MDSTGNSTTRKHSPVRSLLREHMRLTGKTRNDFRSKLRDETVNALMEKLIEQNAEILTTENFIKILGKTAQVS